MVNLAVDTLSGLSASQEQFCQAVARGMLLAEAYKSSHECVKTTTAARRASVLHSDPRVQARLAQLRAEMRSFAGISLVEHVQSLQKLRDQAVAAGQFGPAVTAEGLVGKVSGLYVDKVDIRGAIAIFATRADEEL